MQRRVDQLAKVPGNGNAPDDPEALLLSPDCRLAMLFIAVPEQKQVKTVVHLDMVPLDRRRDEEVDRLLGLGARVEQLGRAFAAVGDLITKVRPDQWSDPTPCTDWTVRRLVEHLIGMNRVFAALLCDEPPPRPAADHIEDDPVGAYRDSAARLLAAFDQPGVLGRTYRGPLGEASGAERLQAFLGRPVNTDP